MSNHGFSILIFVAIISVATAYFNPKLTLDDCSDGTIVVTVTSAEPNGILYVQGGSQSCIQNISSRDATYRISFDACGIRWDTQFNLVVQKNAAYQTNEDGRFPLTCTVNVGQQRISTNIRLQDLAETPAQTKSIRPEASMQLLKNGQDVSGQVVTLSDTITMSLFLDNQYTAGFDVKALSCHASKLQILKDGCSVNLDIFPHMRRVTQGKLEAQFRAFRPTALNGGLVQMPFWCLIEICLGSCQVSMCSDGMRSYGKRSTANIQPMLNGNTMEVDGTQNFNTTVGSSITIAESSDSHFAHEYENKVCMEKHSFGIMLTVLLLCLLAVSIYALVLLRKLRLIAMMLRRFHLDYLCVPSL